MKHRRWIATGATVVALGTAATGAAVAQSGESDDVPITGEALDRATAAALEHVGGGEVVATEVEDDEAADDDADESEVEGRYEVEIALDDGRQVEVELDEEFSVVGEEVEGEDDDEDDDADEGVNADLLPDGA